MRQRRWSARSIWLFEREIELNLFSVRRLAEARKLTDRCVNKQYDCYSFKNIGQPVDELTRVEFWELFNLDRGTKAAVKFSYVAHQFIHSYVIFPFFEGDFLAGFYVCSDYTKNSLIFLIHMSTIKEIFLDVINDEIRSILTEPNPKTREFRKTKIF